VHIQFGRDETFFLFLKICKSPNDAIQRTQASTSIKTT
jgi:hypothetical protein